MEAQKLCTLLILVNFLAIVSCVSSQPQEDTVQKEGGTITETLNKSNEQDRLSEENDDNVCKTEVCKNRATLISSYLNNSVRPCDDFYTYVCDNWINEHKDKGSYDSFKMLQQQYVDALKGIFESTKPINSPQGVLEKPAVLFNACVAFTTDDERQTILDMINSSHLTKWPIPQSTGEERLFNNATEVFLTVGMSPCVQFYVSSNSLNHAAHIIKILPLGIVGVAKEDFQRALELLKSDIKDDGLKNFMDTLVNLHYQWVEHVMANIERIRRRGRYKVTTIESLEIEFRNIPLYSLLQKEFIKAEIPLGKNETVEVYNPGIYEAIDEFLGNADPVVFYNYMGLQAVLQWLSWTPSHVQDEQLRPTYCANLVYSAMKEAVTNLYAKKYFNFTAKMEVEEIVRRIIDATEEVINDTKWMDERSKASSVQKLKGISAKIGYPKWVLNTSVLESLYEYVPTFYPNMSFLNMRYTINENNERKNMEKLRQTYNSDLEWFISESPVHAYFRSKESAFVYPLGGIQSPFYGFGLPASLNFGGIGTIIAHELTHAFARVSPVYKNDAIATLPENETNIFKETAECFEFQYGNITDKETETQLNGKTTLDENMADNSGLYIALRAYQKMVRDDCENKTTKLEGLEDMSSLQLFFVAQGMLWCNATSKEQLKNKILTDSHSASRYRVNVPMRNLEAFAKAFNCSKESPMMQNIPHTCTLW